MKITTSKRKTASDSSNCYSRDDDDDHHRRRLCTSSRRMGGNNNPSSSCRWFLCLLCLTTLGLLLSPTTATIFFCQAAAFTTSTRMAGSLLLAPATRRRSSSSIGRGIPFPSLREQANCFRMNSGRTKSALCMSTEIGNNDNQQHQGSSLTSSSSSTPESEVYDNDDVKGEQDVVWQNMLDKIQDESGKFWEALKRRPKGTPPFKVDDMNLLFYDIFLIINLSVSISFWAVHRLDVSYIAASFNEGCLFSLFWIISGLFTTGAFLYSAVDGHEGNSEHGGPKAAGILGFQTFLNAVNLRIIFALLVAIVQHRPVGLANGEQLMPLEIGFGLILMSFWRTLHSSSVPRM